MTDSMLLGFLMGILCIDAGLVTACRMKMNMTLAFVRAVEMMGLLTILIDDDLENIKRWCKRGGVGLHWEEIDWRADTELVSKLLIERFKLLERYLKKVQGISA